jgi:hypothetical protein
MIPDRELMAHPRIIEPIQNDATTIIVALLPMVGIKAGIADRQIPGPARLKAMAFPRGTALAPIKAWFISGVRITISCPEHRLTGKPIEVEIINPMKSEDR